MIQKLSGSSAYLCTRLKEGRSGRGQFDVGDRRPNLRLNSPRPSLAYSIRYGISRLKIDWLCLVRD